MLSLCVITHHVPHVSGKGEGGVLAVVDTGLVEVAHVDLHGSVILSLDEAVGPAALAGDVKLDVFAFFVVHRERVSKSYGRVRVEETEYGRDDGLLVDGKTRISWKDERGNTYFFSAPAVF